MTVCTFTVAVNKRKKNDQQNNNQPEADFFRVSAWRELGENCHKYLAKGRKVAVVGSVSVSTYTGNDGVMRANLEVQAQDVEFLTPKGEGGSAPAAQSAPEAPPPQNLDAQSGFETVDTEELPF